MRPLPSTNLRLIICPDRSSVRTNCYLMIVSKLQRYGTCKNHTGSKSQTKTSKGKQSLSCRDEKPLPKANSRRASSPAPLNLITEPLSPQFSFLSRTAVTRRQSVNSTLSPRIIRWDKVPLIDKEQVTVMRVAGFP